MKRGFGLSRKELVRCLDEGMVDKPPRDNPDSRNFLTRRVEDYRLSEQIDGIIWACEG
jgi:hypothetical protein